ncbi:MAG: ABC transporter permease [Chloroflexota bacterium]
MPTKPQSNPTNWLPLLLLAALLLLALVIAASQFGLANDDPALVDSTPGQLALWVADQTTQPERRVESWLVWLTKPTAPGGVLSETAALGRARFILGLLPLAVAGLAGYATWVVWKRPKRGRETAVYLLLAYTLLLFNIPAHSQPAYTLVLVGIIGSLLAAFLAPGHVSPRLGFFVIIATILVGWELYKIVGNATGNVLPLTDFPWKLPHWQTVAEALLQPARRNGPQLLVRILAAASWVTWIEAFMGFVVGSLLGFGLGVLFAHNPLLERGLLPYAVASQTVPIIAIAPMIVAWLGQGIVSVAVISAYLAFFPVTINTLRGLLSPDQRKLDLMQSYAASKSTILWKLRLPSALPYIFSALKVASTACVVGAIVGELPSSRSDGLAAAILRASGNYASEPEKLWAAIIMASLVGMLFFGLVSLVEQVTLRGFTVTRER